MERPQGYAIFHDRMEENEQQDSGPKKAGPLFWLAMYAAALGFEALAALLDFMFGAGVLLDIFVNGGAGIFFYVCLTGKGQRPGFWFWSLGGLQFVPVLGAILMALPAWPAIILAQQLKSKSKILRVVASMDPASVTANAKAASWSAAQATMRKKLRNTVGKAGTATITNSMRDSARRSGAWAGRFAAARSVAKDYAAAEVKLDTQPLRDWGDPKKVANKLATKTIEGAAGVHRRPDEREPRSWDDLQAQPQAA